VWPGSGGVGEAEEAGSRGPCVSERIGRRQVGERHHSAENAYSLRMLQRHLGRLGQVRCGMLRGGWDGMGGVGPARLNSQG
jgi:hypothetical protein